MFTITTPAIWRSGSRETQHAHHDLVTATMHVHLDHDHCMENVMLKGPTANVRAFADQMLAERGVRHGQLNMITVEAGDTHGAGRGSTTTTTATCT